MIDYKIECWILQPSLCNEGQFQCKKNLRCIDKRYTCDGDNDCMDGSDEDSAPGGICGKTVILI